MQESSEEKLLHLFLASPRGFCAGVSRAVEIVERALMLYGAPIYVRHEIVHNRHVVEGLREKGAVFVEELEEVPSGARVIFSAHGVSEAVHREAKRRGLKVLDATCPLVSKVHLEVQRHEKAGRHILLVGHGGHPEIAGTIGQVAPSSVTLVGNAEQAEALALKKDAPLAYATQTTLSVEETEEILSIFRKRFPDIEGPRGEDICYATTNRQEAVRQIAPRSDLFLVLGAANSSNALRLVETAERAGAKAARLIENAAAMRWEDVPFPGKVGLTAGASAPECLVEEMVAAFRERFPLRLENIAGKEENVRFKLPASLSSPSQEKRD